MVAEPVVGQVMFGTQIISQSTSKVLICCESRSKFNTRTCDATQQGFCWRDAFGPATPFISAALFVDADTKLYDALVCLSGGRSLPG
jgi:hypothetical protein